jgi:pyroglutamyl-peptidase
MRTLLTGFGPFGEVADNPSARLARTFAERGAPDHALETAVLPVSFQRGAEEITRLLASGRYDACLMLGVAGRSDHIRLERLGVNHDSARIPDNDGRSPMGRSRAGAPLGHQTPFPLLPLLASLHAAGIPAGISHSAGAYVCNRVYFTALDACRLCGLATRCLFVHVPPDPETFGGARAGRGMDLATQARAISLVLEYLRSV